VSVHRSRGGKEQRHRNSQPGCDTRSAVVQSHGVTPSKTVGVRNPEQALFPAAVTSVAA
jgi:hypothetical protein